MAKSLALYATLLFVWLTGCGAEPPPNHLGPVAGAPDLILFNADIYTVDPNQPRAEAFAVRDGKFSAIGPVSEIRALADDHTKLVDAAGMTVTPGFIDGHTHIDIATSLTTGIDLTDVVDKQQWLEMIAAKIATMQPGEWLFGGAWNHLLGDGGLPTIEMLDAVAPHNPVILNDIDFHNAWVNSKALELTGVGADSEVPPGGLIMLNASGQPSGILQEGAMFLVFGHPLAVPAVSPVESFKTAQKHLNSLGITGVHDMRMSQETDESVLQVMRDNMLTLRVWKGAFLSEDGNIQNLVAQRQEIKNAVTEYGSQAGGTDEPRVTLGYVKTIMDGVISTHTALMYDPYSDLPNIEVEAMRTSQELAPAIRAANEAGFGFAIHAIGDKAISNALDSFEVAGTNAAFPNRIEHLEFIRPWDIDRMRQLRIVASMQPLHMTAGVGLYSIKRVGIERTLTMGYLWKTMLDNDIPLVLGSDWPTAPVNPLQQMDSAQKRTTWMDGELRHFDEGVNAISFEQSLFGYTQAGANMTEWQDQIGSISTGKWADFVVLDKRLPNTGLRNLDDVSVQATYLSGRMIYQDKP